MTELDAAVQRAVETYRKTYLIATIVAIGLPLFSGDFLIAGFTAILMLGLYHVGLVLVGHTLAAVLPKSVLVEELRSKRIAEINRRLDEGTLEAGTEELETLMTKAGLEPLHVITGYGPVFGTQFDAEMYEWIQAKKGREGDDLKYTFVGVAEFDKDGVVEVPNDHGMFLVLDGFLYEHSEPKNPVVQQPQTDVQ